MEKIENIKGMLIDTDGKDYPFAIFSFIRQIYDSNLHDDVFRREIENAEWFKNAQIR